MIWDLNQVMTWVIITRVCYMTWITTEFWSIDSDNAEGLEEPSSISGLAASSLLSSGTPVTKATHHHASKSTSGLEEMESEGKAWWKPRTRIGIRHYWLSYLFPFQCKLEK